MTITTSASTPLEFALDGLPIRPRVHEVAKRAGLSSRETIAALADQGIVVSSAASAVAHHIAVAFLTEVLSGGPMTGEVPFADRVEAAASDPPTADPLPVVPTEVRAEGAEPFPAEAEEAGGRRRRGRGSSRSRSGRGRATTPGEQTEDDRPGEQDLFSSIAVDDSTGESPVHAEPVFNEGLLVEQSAAAADQGTDEDPAAESNEVTDDEAGGAGRRRRRRGRRGRGRVNDTDEHGEGGEDETDEAAVVAERPVADAGVADGGAAGADVSADAAEDAEDETGEDEPGSGEGANRRRRRRRRRGAGEEARTEEESSDSNTVVHVREPRTAADDAPVRMPSDNVQGVRGSTRLEAKRQRRRDTRDSRRRPQILTEAEFLARRESVDRVMAVRQRGGLAQVALLEDGVLVEHFVSRAGTESLMGNIYLGKVQNVLPSMEAAFVDIGRGRNAVIYAGEVDWDSAGLAGKARRIETALGSGDSILVQVSKDPIGHKGARLTTQISLPGRFLVYVPGGGATGISRKLPDIERKRLKSILDRIVPEDAGVIIRTAAEGVAEDELIGDVERLQAQWQDISKRANNKSNSPELLSSEPDTLIRVVRDLFNSDISTLLLDGEEAWTAVSEYVTAVAPELAPRVQRYAGRAADVFTEYRIDEQILKALQRKVHLPSGGSLVIDRTEAMTVVDVNTGKFTGSGGNLEETVTKNNLEAAEEMVRQLRLRDIGGIIVVDFIDMVLESNRELVLRRLTECLGRDRTRHQVAEVTSLGLVQMTRKKMGTGLVEAFSEPCEHCGGRGIVVHDLPAEPGPAGFAGAETPDEDGGGRGGRARRGRRGADDREAARAPVTVVRPPDPRGPKPRAADVPAPVASGDEAGEGSPVLLFGRPAAEPVLPIDGVFDDAPAPDPYSAAQWLVEEPVAKPARRRGRRSAARPAGAPGVNGADVPTDDVAPADEPVDADGHDQKTLSETAVVAGELSHVDVVDGGLSDIELTEVEFGGVELGDVMAGDGSLAAELDEIAGTEVTTENMTEEAAAAVAAELTDSALSGEPETAAPKFENNGAPEVSGEAPESEIPLGSAADAELLTVGAAAGEEMSTKAPARPRRRRAATRPAGPAGG